jgi:hypothetical protein
MLGFFRRSSGWPLFIRPESAAVPDAAFDYRNWFVTAGDANVDPRQPLSPASAGR